MKTTDRKQPSGIREAIECLALGFLAMLCVVGGVLATVGLCLLVNQVCK